MLIQRYLFRELLKPAVYVTLALSALALLTQILTMVDLMVTEKQQLATFLKLLGLSIPGLVPFVVPVSAFVSTLMATNRLHSDQEIVVCYAAGLDTRQVMGPTLRLAAGAALVVLVLNLWIAPICAREIRNEMFRIRTDLASNLIDPGQFTDSGRGLTVYAQRRAPSGMFQNIFIYQQKPDGETSTISAKQGRIETVSGAPRFVLIDGSDEELSHKGVLNFLQFREYVLDLRPYMPADAKVDYRPSDLFMHELLFPDPAKAVRPQLKRKMIAEAHSRIASPLYLITMALLALYAVLGGQFSRFGYGRRIMIAAGVALAVRLMGVVAQAASDNNIWLNVVQYVLPVAPSLYLLQRLVRGGWAKAERETPALAPLSPMGA